jgi:aminoglycoside phosphotransferase (APT) family kinase protein
MIPKPATNSQRGFATVQSVAELPDALTDSLMAWVRSSVAPDCRVEQSVGMRQGGSPWLISLSGSAVTEVVLRLGSEADRQGFETEIAALAWANTHGFPAPVLLATDLGSTASPGTLAVLTTALAGSSRLSTAPSATRLRALGETLAVLHQVPPPSSPSLPQRARPIGLVDFDALRRSAPLDPLLVRAEGALSRLRIPDSDPVFVHGDFWHGNALWESGVISCIVDWDCAGVGPIGVDLGSLRCDAALCAGDDGPTEVLAGYERVAGRPVDDVAYWDVVAALATPPTMAWFVDAIRDQGRTDLNQPILLARRDGFLSAALEQLG